MHNYKKTQLLLVTYCFGVIPWQVCETWRLTIADLADKICGCSLYHMEHCGQKVSEKKFSVPGVVPFQICLLLLNCAYNIHLFHIYLCMLNLDTFPVPLQRFGQASYYKNSENFVLRCLLHILKSKEYLQCLQFVIEQTRTLPDQSKCLCDFQESIFWYKMVMGSICFKS